MTAEKLAGACEGTHRQGVLPDHLVLLKEGEWALWRWVCVRGAGFPASAVLRLGAGECAAKAAAAIESEAQVDKARKAAVAVFEQQRRSYAASGEGEKKPHELAGVLKQLRRKKAPDPTSTGGPGSLQLAALRDAVSGADSAWRSYRQEYERSVQRTSTEILAIARDDRFREAVIWQNRRAFHTALRQIDRDGSDGYRRGTKQRQHEELVASYLQRYCVKNDTIGFFGPVGWAEFQDQGSSIETRHGREFLSDRRLCFEVWCIDAIGEALSRDEGVRVWLPPRLLPVYRLSANELHSPFGPPTVLSAPEAGLLRICDGRRSASDIAASLVNGGPGPFKQKEDVYRLLAELRDRLIISWVLEAPAVSHPEATLKSAVEQIKDAEVRRRVSRVVSEIESARHNVSLASGQPDRLDRAMAEFETTFTRLTGVAATRSHGQLYAGRTLLYEDCRRGVSIDIGPEIRESLSGPLSLVLASARWFTAAVAAVYRRAFKQVYSGLASETRSQAVELAHFWRVAGPMIQSDEAFLLKGLLHSFQERWSDVLSIPDGRSRVRYKSDELRPVVLAAFKTARPGWKLARYHNPDVMICAPNVDAINRGDYEFVLGEAHAGTNTLNAPLFIEMHDTPQRLRDAFEADIPEARLTGAIPKHSVNATGRLLPAWLPAKDFRVDMAPGAYVGSHSQVLPISEMVVEERDKGLIIRTRDGRLSFDVIEGLSDALRGPVAETFQMMLPKAHTPRINFDRLVVCRETWRFPVSEISFAVQKEGVDRFAEAIRWSHALSLPRYCFVKAPVEVKPFYVDFSSPIYVDILARLVRKSLEADKDAVITISEMLPAHDQTWLLDSAGQRYTSELRIVALDLTN
jgi:hypothetical protein